MKTYGSRRGLAGKILQTLPGKLASHWLFQGMLYMDPTERAYKLGLDVVIACFMYTISKRFLPNRCALTMSLAGAHSANFLFNGHLWGAVKWHVKTGPDSTVLHTRLNGIVRRLSQTHGVSRIYVYGSLSRDEVHAGSDLDIRVLRASGPLAGATVCMAVSIERCRAFLDKVPLDIYVWDSSSRAASMRSDETPLEFTSTRFSGPFHDCLLGCQVDLTPPPAGGTPLPRGEGELYPDKQLRNAALSRSSAS